MTDSNNKLRTEKTLKEQIIEKMIANLRDSENFNDELLEDLEVTDLSRKKDVKEVISSTKEEDNENTQTGD